MDLLLNDVAKGLLKENHGSRLFYLTQYKAEEIVYGRLEEGQREKSEEGSTA